MAGALYNTAPGVFQVAGHEVLWRASEPHVGPGLHRGLARVGRQEKQKLGQQFKRGLICDGNWRCLSRATRIGALMRDSAFPRQPGWWLFRALA
jgi:hypothetical protein